MVFSSDFTLKVKYPNYMAAWRIEVEPLVQLSKEYNLDFKIYASERGMQFEQDIEIVKGEVIKNNVIKFDDYELECNTGG